MPNPDCETEHASDQRTAAINRALLECLQLGPGCPERLAEAMRYAVLGPGKRLRPRLVLMATEACGSAPVDAMPAACAVELIHAYSLVHDDLPAMDNDDLRRGRPTCHIQFDEATAILVGDALQARAFELLATRITPPQVAAQCCAELATAAGAEHLVGGQADDLAGVVEGLSDEDTADHLRRIHARKTGALFVASLRLGAIVAQADADQLQCITDFGRALGLAFQVTDDLLDVSGDEETVGKRVGKDADVGKLTYPALLGVPQSRELAHRLVEEARRAIAPFGDRAAELLAVADKVASRDH